MMTRKDYVKVANILNGHLQDLQPLDENQNEVDSLMRTANEFANYFEEDNPRFDRPRFMQAFIEGY